MTESGVLVNPENKTREVLTVTVMDTEGDASSGPRRSSRVKSRWTSFFKEDCCTRRRSLGEIS